MPQPQIIDYALEGCRLKKKKIRSSRVDTNNTDTLLKLY